MDHRIEFTESENPWAPTAVIAEINGRTGSGLELVGLAEQTGGTSSAAYVQWPDGRPGALTRTWTPLARMRLTADVVSMVRSHGLPVPRHDLVLELADGAVAVVQERMPGSHASHVDADVIDVMVAMNDRFAGLLTDHPDVPRPPAFPPPGDHRWHETLGRYSDHSRRLLGRLTEMDRTCAVQMTGDDVVHLDYSVGNILFDEHGQITGVIDWNFGVARGDRRLALLGMKVHLTNEGDGYGAKPEAVDRLDQILADTIDPALLRLYWAHVTVHRVHWAIENNLPPERIGQELDLAERHLT